jgi:hypothetical protein
MKIQAEYQDGLLVKISEDLSVYYDQCGHKIKLIKDQKVINSFSVDHLTYTLSDFIEYIAKISKDEGRR